MSSPQGLVTYPGLVDFTKADYTLSQGISPGVCTIEMPQELVGDLEPFGDLTFSYGDSSITLRDCTVDLANIGQSLGGYIARVNILDRRWRWKFGYVSGHFNLRMPTGNNADEGLNSQARAVDGDATKIRPGTEATPQQMAILCLQKMGEQNYDVSALPNAARPEIDWSYTNPAEALQSLCEELGCRVVLWLDDDSVRIVTIGQGNGLPDNDAVTFVSEGVNPPETPSSLLLVGGPTVYQGLIPVEAVGVDLDGSIKPIDALSYAPTGGWANSGAALDDFTFITSAKAKPLAEKCIYKMWRLAMPIEVPSNEGVAVGSIQQIKLCANPFTKQ